MNTPKSELNAAQFFDDLKKIDFDDQWFESLEKLNDFYDDLLDKKEYELCNELIEQFHQYKFSYLLHMGLLTITNRRKSHLQKSRPKLYQITKDLASAKLTPKQTISALRNLE